MITAENVCLIAEFTADVGQSERVQELIADYAKVVRDEPGNIAFDPYTHRDSPEKFIVHEIYTDVEAFQAHLGGSAGAIFNRALRPLILEPESVVTFLSPAAADHTSLSPTR